MRLRYVLSPYEDAECGCTAQEEEFDKDREYDSKKERELEE